MDNIIKRHANLSILVAVLFAQILGLAIQIKRPAGDNSDDTALIRQWTVAVVTPIEKAFVNTTGFFRDTWSNYFYLRNVRRENEQLRKQIEQMRLEQVRMQQDAAQARRLQALLAFKEQYISETVPAQVIGTSGSELSRVIYIDRGSDHGLRENMAVITPDGIVGKVLRVFPGTAQVLVISDQTSGVGAILENTRLQGILKGSADGTVNVEYIMADEKVAPGEPVITSGGDRIFPKGLPVGTVSAVAPGKNMFLRIRVSPAANLSKLEEVLVITKVVEKGPDPNEIKGPVRAADILAERLPSVPQKPAEGEKGTTGTPGGTATPAPQAGAQPSGPNTSAPPKPAPTTGATTNTKPATTPNNTTSTPVSGASKPAPANSKPANAETNKAVPKPAAPASNTSPSPTAQVH